MTARPLSPAPSGPEVMPLAEFKQLHASGKVRSVARKRNDLHHKEQTDLFWFLSIHTPRYPDLRWIHAVPNGVNLSPRERKRITDEGRKAGIWDVHVPVPRAYRKNDEVYYHCSSRGMYLEIKIPPDTLTEEQEAFRAQLEPHGYRFEVARSWTEAGRLIGQHVGIPESDTAFWSALADRADREKGGAYARQ